MDDRHQAGAGSDEGCGVIQGDATDGDDRQVQPAASLLEQGEIGARRTRLCA